MGYPRKKYTPLGGAEMSIILSVHHAAVSLLLNLGAAQQGRSVLFSDEQRLLFEGRNKGFVMNTKLDFMR
jgi:hypothetical protein